MHDPQIDSTTNALVPDGRQTLLVFVAGIELWLLNHPYFGIWHDARIYTLMAVHWLNPSPYAADPWFSGNSADGLSIFAPLYGTLIKWLGISLAAKTMTLAGGFAWLVAIWKLGFGCFERRAAIFIFLALASISLTYCLGRPIFVLSEGFVTARLFATSASIIGLVAVIGGRFRTGLTLQLVGMLFHPLMSIWGLLATICLRATDRVVVVMTTITLSITAAMFLNPADLPSLRIMSQAWQAAVAASAMVVFLDPWPKIAINDAFWCFSMLLFAGRFGQAKLQRLYQVVCLISAWALLVSLIASYFFPVVIFLQTQFWRALWLAVLFGFVAEIDIGWSATKAGALGKGMVGLMIATFLFRDWGGGLILFLAFCCWSTGSLQLSSFVQNKRKLATRIVWVLVGGAFACALPDLLMDAWILGGMERNAALGLLDEMRKLAIDLSSYTLVPLLMWGGLALPQWSRRYAIAAAVGVGVFLLLVVTQWDKRSELRKHEESRYTVGGNRDIFFGLIQPGKQVYWNGHALRTWFDLGTASYVSSEQAIGIVFSETRMQEVKRRLERTILKSREPSEAYPVLDDGALLAARHRKVVESHNDPLDLHAYETAVPITKAGLIYLCRDPLLDFVIDTAYFPLWSVSSYSEIVKTRTITYYLYDCRKLPMRAQSRDGHQS